MQNCISNSNNEYSSSGYKWGLLGLARISYHSGSSYTYEYPITNYRGDIVSHFADYKNYYDAYGNERRTPSDSSPFGYCGEYKDEESGLVYLRARMYDPSIGRFISEDPIKDGDNRYM